MSLNWESSVYLCFSSATSSGHAGVGEVGSCIWLLEFRSVRKKTAKQEKIKGIPGVCKEMIKIIVYGL